MPPCGRRRATARSIGGERHRSKLCQRFHVRGFRPHGQILFSRVRIWLLRQGPAESGTPPWFPPLRSAKTRRTRLVATLQAVMRGQNAKGTDKDAFCGFLAQPAAFRPAPFRDRPPEAKHMPNGAFARTAKSAQCALRGGDAAPRIERRFGRIGGRALVRSGSKAIEAHGPQGTVLGVVKIGREAIAGRAHLLCYGSSPRHQVEPVQTAVRRTDPACRIHDLTRRHLDRAMLAPFPCWSHFQ